MSTLKHSSVTADIDCTTNIFDKIWTIKQPFIIVALCVFFKARVYSETLNALLIIFFSVFISWTISNMHALLNRFKFYLLKVLYPVVPSSYYRFISSRKGQYSVYTKHVSDIITVVFPFSTRHIIYNILVYSLFKSLYCRSFRQWIWYLPFPVLPRSFTMLGTAESNIKITLRSHWHFSKPHFVLQWF